MNYRTTLLIILSFMMVACQHTALNNNATIVFEDTEYNFGELEMNSNGDCNFVFENPGNTPLVIQHVKTSCGCTVPQWPTKPIKPSKGGEIKINYDTSHPGVFNKTITVFYNGKDSPITLIIKGRVKYPDLSLTTETIGTSGTKET